jgi:hypothetical protein
LGDQAAQQPEPAKTSQQTTIVMPTYELSSPDLPEPIMLEPASDLILEPEPVPEPVEALDIQHETLEAAVVSFNQADLDSFWDATPSDSPTTPTSSGNALSFDQAIKLGLVPKEDNK